MSTFETAKSSVGFKDSTRSTISTGAASARNGWGHSRDAEVTLGSRNLLSFPCATVGTSDDASRVRDCVETANMTDCHCSPAALRVVL